MDPLIVKFIKQEEDETIHSRADVNAFTVALNRDIEGTKPTPQPSGSGSARLSQGSNYSSNHSVAPQHPANFQLVNNKPTNPNQNVANAAKNQKKVSFMQLISVIVPQLDKDKSRQLQALYIKLRRNEVSKEGFLRLVQEIVGDQMIKRALYKLQNHDETMHSGADVDAFTAALNRDIEGNKSTSQPSGSDSACLSQGSNYSSNHSVSPWRNSTQEENTGRQVQQDMTSYQRQELHMSSMVGNISLHTLPIRAQRVQNQQTMPPQHPANLQGTITQKTMPPQHPSNLQRTSNQQTMPPQHPANFQRVNNQPTNRNQNSANAAKNKEQVSFGKLIPMIVPQLDKDKRQQLQALYIKLRRNEVSKDGFLRLMQEIVGDQMIKRAVYKLRNQAKATDSVANVETLKVAFDNMFTSAAPTPSPISGQSINLKTTTRNGSRQVNFAKFLPLITRQLDKNKFMQLETLYDRIRRNEVSKEEFLRLMEELVGETMVKLAVHRLLTKGP